VALLTVLAIRMATRSDLGGHMDQSKTLAFTADIVLNGEWILPRDGAGFRTMKPPLVNWIGALLPALGVWEEWALKFPSILGAAVTVGLTVWMTRRMMLTAAEVEGRVAAGGTIPDARRRWATASAAAAGVIYLAGEDTVKHAYFLRPDMLNVALLTAAWALGTVALSRQDARPRRAVVAAFWLVVGAAFLTKGFTGLIPVLYVALFARLIQGRWSAADGLGWRWGLPLAAVAPGAWLVLAYRVDPDHVTRFLLDVETVQRVTGDRPATAWLRNCLEESWKIPAWFMARFYPWPIPAVVALVRIGPARWFRHAMAPAVLWVLLVMVFFLPVTRKEPSYVMPAYPAVASLAAYALVTGVGRLRLAPATVAAVGIALIFTLGGLRVALRFETPAGDHQKAFVRSARPLVGDETVVFLGLRDASTITLFGRHQAGLPTPEAQAAARWVVRSVEGPAKPGADGDLVLVLTSGPVRGRRGGEETLGLFRRSRL